MTRNPITDGETVLAPLWGSMMNAHAGEAILNGIEPSVGTGDWEVDTTAGDIFRLNIADSVASATTSLTAPADDPDLDSGEFRVDLLTTDGSGISVAEGTAAAQPITPDIPPNEPVICAVVVSGDATSLQAGDIRDYRTLLESDKDRYVDGGPHEIDASEFSGANGTNNQVLKSDGSAANWQEEDDESWWYFSFLAGQDESFDASNHSKAYNVDFDRITTNNTTFEGIGESNSGNSATLRMRDNTNNNTIASVSTTSGTIVRLTDTSWSVPTGSVTVGVDSLSDTDIFETIGASASSS